MAVGERHPGDLFRFIKSVGPATGRIEGEQEEIGDAGDADAFAGAGLLGRAGWAGRPGRGPLRCLNRSPRMRSLMVMGP